MTRKETSSSSDLRLQRVIDTPSPLFQPGVDNGCIIRLQWIQLSLKVRIKPIDIILQKGFDIHAPCMFRSFQQESSKVSHARIFISTHPHVIAEIASSKNRAMLSHLQ